jgi:hypothetical protein
MAVHGDRIAHFVVGRRDSMGGVGETFPGLFNAVPIRQIHENRAMRDIIEWEHRSSSCNVDCRSLSRMPDSELVKRIWIQVG